MERHGFVRDMLDVKILILYVTSRILFPVDIDKLYELCYQDDALSYFDLCEAVPQMVESGHLRELPNKKYEITESGREIGSVMEDTVAYPVAQRAKAAAEKFNRELRRDSLIHTEIVPRPAGDVSVIMGMDDETGNLLTLELMAPTMRQARKLEKAFRGNAERIYHTVMTELLAGEDDKENS